MKKYFKEVSKACNIYNRQIKLNLLIKYTLLKLSYIFKNKIVFM